MSKLSWETPPTPSPDPSPVQDAGQGNAHGVVVPQAWLDRLIRGLTRPLAQVLASVTWITPNRISMGSAGIGGPLAAGCIGLGQPLMAAVLIAISGILDNLDGDLARTRGIASKEGEILDSVLDRYVDFCLVAALVLVSPQDHLIVGLVALLGTTLMPYVRARSEAAGKSTVTSVGDRTIRTLVIIVGLAAGQILAVLIVLAVLSNIAALHRLLYAVQSPSADP